MISPEDFSKLELKVGTVLEAEDVEGSDILLKPSSKVLPGTKIM